MKVRSIYAVALALTLALSGCSTGQNSSAPAVSPEPSSSEPSSQASSEAPSETPKTSEAPETPEAPSDTQTLRVAGLKGPTAMGMVKLMEDSASGQSAQSYEFTLAGSPDELVGKLVQGELDIAAVPTNLAATLYQKTEGRVQMAALNTLGVLYLVEAGDSIQSIADLKGRTVYSTGKGATPEFAMNYILTQNGLTPGTDVLLDYKTEHTELASLLAAGQADLAVLPQPFVTSALSQNDKLRVALDLTAEWDKAAEGKSQLTMGCLVIQKSLAEEQPELVREFLTAYKASTDFVTAPENLEAAAALIEKFDILKAAPAQKALPQCNIVCITGDEMKTMASGFFEVLFSADPKSVGGKLPDDGLYYVG